MTGTASWWGCGRGPSKRLAAHARLAVGALLLVACGVSPVLTLPGLVLTAVAVLPWTAACRPPVRVMAWAALLAVALFAPLLLLAPLTPVPDGSTWGMRLAPPASASLHGVATLLIAVATVSSVPLPELQGGLARLPLPSVVTVLVAQMAFQSRALADESRRVAAALAVRGATARRGAGWQVARSLPATWLPRVLLRAERVAAAMDVRGYVDHDPRVASREGWGSRDLAVVAVAGAVFTLALALRFGGAG